MELTDGVIRLSPLCLEDIEPHLAGEDAELVRWLSGGIGTRQSVEEYIRRCLDQWETGGPVHAFGIRVGLAELAGTTEVQFDRPYLGPGTVNISYGLYPSWRGRGIATRALLLAGAHAAAAGAAQGVLRIEPGNTSSVAVALRAGYIPFRQSEESDGRQFNWYTKTLPA
ncbi:GNAT family N-acetyltransferase [Arthrobacter sp. D1-29]